MLNENITEPQIEQLDDEVGEFIWNLWVFLQSLEESTEPSEVILEFELPENFELESSVIEKIKHDDYLRTQLEDIKKKLQKTDVLQNLVILYYRNESNEKNKKILENLLAIIMQLLTSDEITDILKKLHSFITKLLLQTTTEDSGETTTEDSEREQDKKEKLKNMFKNMFKNIYTHIVMLYLNDTDFKIIKLSSFDHFCAKLLQDNWLSLEEKTNIWLAVTANSPKIDQDRFLNLLKNNLNTKNAGYNSLALLLTLKQIRQTKDKIDFLSNIQAKILKILEREFQKKLGDSNIEPIAKEISVSFNTPEITSQISTEIKENQLIVNIEVKVNSKNKNRHTIKLELNLDELSGQDMVSILTKIINIYKRLLIILNRHIDITLKNITSIDDFFKKLTEAIAPIAFEFHEHGTKHFIDEKENNEKRKDSKKDRLTRNQIHTWHNNQEMIEELLRVFSLSTEEFSDKVKTETNNVEIENDTEENDTKNNDHTRYAILVTFEKGVNERMRIIQILRGGEVQKEVVDSNTHRLHIIVDPFTGTYNVGIKIYTIYVASI